MPGEHQIKVRSRQFYNLLQHSSSLTSFLVPNSASEFGSQPPAIRCLDIHLH